VLVFSLLSKSALAPVAVSMNPLFDEGMASHPCTALVASTVT
jgi:hypothetical protein